VDVIGVQCGVSKRAKHGHRPLALQGVEESGMAAPSKTIRSPLLIGSKIPHFNDYFLGQVVHSTLRYIMLHVVLYVIL
jgi:hypothetical protein